MHMYDIKLTINIISQPAIVTRKTIEEHFTEFAVQHYSKYKRCCDPLLLWFELL